MTIPSERDDLREIISRCQWLIEYYKRFGETSKSEVFLRKIMEKARADLAALTQTAPDES